jgi:uncharacterized protein (DUF983 family)
MNNDVAAFLAAFLLVNICFLISTIVVFKDDIENPVWVNIIFSLIIELITAIALLYWSS